MVSRRAQATQIAEKLPDAWHDWLSAKSVRLALWLPVALAAGILLWFALPRAAPALAVGFALARMAAVEARVACNAHAMLAERMLATFDTQVAVVEPLAGGGQRLVLAAVEGSLPGGTARARLTLRGEAPMVPVGAKVRLRGLL